MAEPDRFLDAFITVQRRLARLVMGIVPPRDVEDIVQETYVRVCQVKNKGAIRDLHSFMFRTAKNLSLDHIKRAESRLTDGVDDIDSIQPSELDSTYAQVVTDEEFVLFCEAVRELPKQSRRAFILKKVYGYTLKEIMVEMGLGQATVETHIVNGTKKCVQYMRDRQEQPAGRHLTSRNSNVGSTRRRPGGEL